MTILGLWEEYWREQNPRARRKLERSAEYRAALEPLLKTGLACLVPSWRAQGPTPVSAGVRP